MTHQNCIRCSDVCDPLSCYVCGLRLLLQALEADKTRYMEMIENMQMELWAKDKRMKDMEEGAKNNNKSVRRYTQHYIPLADLLCVFVLEVMCFMHNYIHAYNVPSNFLKPVCA